MRRSGWGPGCSASALAEQPGPQRSEEHTSELQSRRDIVCRLLLEKKNNNYFKAPWMPDRTEANPNKLNHDDARYGFRCCYLINIWTGPLPPEPELSRQMPTPTTSIDIIGLQAAYAYFHTD